MPKEVLLIEESISSLRDIVMRLRIFSCILDNSHSQEKCIVMWDLLPEEDGLQVVKID